MMTPRDDTSTQHTLKQNDALDHAPRLVAALDAARDRVRYLDLIRALLERQLTIPELRRLKDAQRGPIHKPHRTKHDVAARGWPHVIQVKRPTVDLLQEIERLDLDHALSRIEIATDCGLDGIGRRELSKAFMRHAVVRMMKTQRIWIEGSTIYFARKGAPRNFVLYPEERSRVGIGACLHSELRLQRKGNLESLGLFRLADLTPNRLDGIVRQTLHLFAVDNGTAINRAINAEIEKYKTNLEFEAWREFRLMADAPAHLRERELKAADHRRQWVSKLFNSDAPELMHNTRWHEAYITNLLAFARKATSRHLIEIDNGILNAGVRWMGSQL